MANEWKKLFGDPLSGITRPAGSNDKGGGMAVYEEKEKEPRGPGLIDVPGDILKQALLALAGGTTLLVARKIGVSDALDRQVPPKKAKESEKVRKKRLKAEEKNREWAQGITWSRQIDSVTRRAEADRKNPLTLAVRAFQVIGEEGMKKVDAGLVANQGTPEKIKRVTPAEIILAQRIKSLSENMTPDEAIKLIEEKVRELALDNLSQAGLKIVDSNEKKELRILCDESDLVVASTSWWEGILAGIMGATGGNRKSVNGGYLVKIYKSDLAVQIGEDPGSVAPPDQIVVKVDIPPHIGAALQVATEKVPLLRGKFSRLILKMISQTDSQGVRRIPLVPGRVDVVGAGGGAKAFYPALNALSHMSHIEAIAQVGARLQSRVIELDEIKSNISKREIEESTILGALEVPRSTVVNRVQKQISTTGKNVFGDMNKYIKGLAGDIGNGDEQVKAEPSKSGIDLDLSKAGYPKMMFKGLAENILKNGEKHLKDLEKRFGRREGQRLYAIVQRRARSVFEQNRD